MGSEKSHNIMQIEKSKQGDKYNGRLGKTEWERNPMKIHRLAINDNWLSIFMDAVVRIPSSK